MCIRDRLYAFCCRFTGYSFRKEMRFIRRVPSAIRYGAMLLCEIFKANVTVIKMILDKNFEPKPQLVRFDSGLDVYKRQKIRWTALLPVPSSPCAM